MGEFKVKVSIGLLTDPSRSVEVDALVDAGATFSVIPKSALERVGIQPTGTIQATLADGRQVERPAAWVAIALDGRKAPGLVIVGEPGDASILGVTALEMLLMTVDPVAQKLIPRTALLY